MNVNWNGKKRRRRSGGCINKMKTSCSVALRERRVDAASSSYRCCFIFQSHGEMRKKNTQNCIRSRSRTSWSKKKKEIVHNCNNLMLNAKGSFIQNGKLVESVGLRWLDKVCLRKWGEGRQSRSFARRNTFLLALRNYGEASRVVELEWKPALLYRNRSAHKSINPTVSFLSSLSLEKKGPEVLAAYRCR